MSYYGAFTGIAGIGMAVIVAIALIIARDLLRSWQRARRVLADADADAAQWASVQQVTCRACQPGQYEDIPPGNCTCTGQCGHLYCTVGSVRCIPGRYCGPGCECGRHCEYCHGLAMEASECGCGADGCRRPWCPRYDTAVTW